MHYSIDPDRYICSIHEIAHAYLAFECGFPVESISVNDVQGCARIRLPLTPEQFAARYQDSPIMAVAHATQAVAIYRAGSFIAENGGPSKGDDLQRIEAWHRAIVATCGSAAWAPLYAEVIRGLQAWARHQGVRTAIAEMGKVLCERGKVNHFGFETLLGLVDATSCPAPSFIAMLPSAKPATPPAVRHALAPVPDYEDATSRGYILAEEGDYTLLRIVGKLTGTTKYVLGKQDGHGGWESQEYPGEAAGRRALQRALKGEQVA